jgi:hypothetical protein
MGGEVFMTNEKAREHVERIRIRYGKAIKKEKTRILEEFCINWGYHRKYAITMLQTKKSKKYSRKKGPAPVYAGEIIDVLRAIWNASGNPCSKRLKPTIPLYLPWYKKDNAISKETESKLSSISPATIDRKLKPFRLMLKRKGYCSTRPGSLLKNHIPIKTDNWDVTQPGYLEADSVAHCGDSMAGDFAFTIVCVDIKTGWVEQRAIWNKGQAATLRAIKDIEESLPFELLGFDCDNGSEFLNNHLWRYCEKRPEGKRVQFTRSRPYKKDDNAHVEQKNWTHVRQLLGYARFDMPGIVDLLNDLYTKEWNWYVNYFCTSMKLISSTRIGSKRIKKYDKPRTPFQRLCESDIITTETRIRHSLFMKKLNPFELNQSINDKVHHILEYIR